MMNITINGNEDRVPDDLSVEALLARRNLDPEGARGIAVAVNDRVIPRKRWEAEIVTGGDRVEVITARQGG